MGKFATAPAARPAPSPAVRSARLAVCVMFAVNGALLGSWAPRIPSVQATLGVGPGLLGVTLLALAVGSLVAMPLAGWLVHRLGTRGVLVPTTVAACLLPSLLGLASSVPTMWPVLFSWGLALGAMDVAMNAQAVTVQQSHPALVLNGIHACFSLGGLLGALAGTVAAATGVAVGVQMAGVGLAGLLLALPLRHRMLPDTAYAPREEHEPVTHRGRQPIQRRPAVVLALCTAAFTAMLCEGAASDWSAVFLTERGAPSGVAGLGFVAFATAMFLGRLAGDPLSHRWGRTRTAAIAAGLGALGALLGLLLPGTAAGVLSFIALGLGLACLMPFLFATVGDTDTGLGPVVAAISTSGYIGLLIGPALLGGIAELADVATALHILPALLLASALLSLAGTRRHAVPDTEAGDRERIRG